MSIGLRSHGAALLAFAEEVGADGPVTVRGGGTQWEVGGAVDPSAREVRAPAGGIEVEPAELIVRCGAGTPVAELDRALLAAGLDCPIDPRSPDLATVGGVLSVGHSGVRRLRYGHVRDLLLEARYVAADGRLVRAGAPVVKNVTGYDLCRLLVGSLGTLGLLGEVVLRCRPRAATRRWLRSSDADPFAVRRVVHDPSSVLWDGSVTWVLLEGSIVEVDAAARSLTTAGTGWTESDAPDLPPHRWSTTPGAIRSLVAGSAPAGHWVAEIGVGTIHADTAPPLRTVERPDLHDAVKAAYDPTGRLNPGRSVA